MTFTQQALDGCTLLSLHADLLIHSRIKLLLEQEISSQLLILKKKMETVLCFRSLKIHNKYTKSTCMPSKKDQNNLKLPLLCTCFVLSGAVLSTREVQSLVCNPEVLFFTMEISIASPSRGFLQKLLALQNVYLAPLVLNCTMSPIKP